MYKQFFRIFSVFFVVFCAFSVSAQPDRWQQRAEYDMDIDFNVNTHQFNGKQKIVYYNNSPDTLKRVFYHLYFNAFQPGSMMDIRSRTIMDPDFRVASRIKTLKDDEIGFHEVLYFKQDGQDAQFETVGTILEVELAKPIMPNSKTVLEMEFESQVPVQVRRSGRDNAEGISYSMSQWYPKLCEYDYQGWHANPYVGREFYGVWSDFDVKIAIDKDYIIGATGYLQNKEEIGFGYNGDSQEGAPVKGGKRTYHFFAPDVHDFVWGADPDYKHTSQKAENGPMMHFFFQETEDDADEWARLPDIMNEAFKFINKKYGKYPYEQYSFIQGGDGGMEYPMATLITGNRTLPSLVGVSVHELMHSWYQMLLGTNESLYPWMDEGFTSFATAEVMNYLRSEGLLPGKAQKYPWKGSYTGYFNIAQSEFEQPLSTHADHYNTNQAYWVGAYSKGAVFLAQLQYVIGKQAFDRGMLEYFKTWSFKHPNDNDFIRVMEKVSGLELDWYKEYFVYTTYTIDYGIKEIKPAGKGKAIVVLERLQPMPMPIDLLVTYQDDSQEMIHIPLRIMRGEKPQENDALPYTIATDWPWTNPEYELQLSKGANQVKSIEIDPTGRLADINSENNVFPR